MSKTAGVKALGIEALVGSVLGTGAGLAGGGAKWSPKEPVEWTDETGRVYSRNLTEDEKRKRSSYLARAALLGALGGTAAVPLAAAGRRAFHSTIEARQAKEVADDFLAPFRGVVRQFEDQAKRPKSTGTFKPAGGTEWKKEDRLAKKGKELLTKQEKAVKDLLGSAQSARKEAPFGGLTTGSVPGPGSTGHAQGKAQWGQRTHRGQVSKHIAALQKEHDLPKFSLDVPEFWRQYVRTSLTKTSSVEEAFLDEAADILQLGCATLEAALMRVA